MKKILIILVTLFCTTNSFAQQTGGNLPTLKDEYLLKSQKQKKTARILLIGGAGLVVTAFAIPRGELVYDGICIGIYCSDEYKNDDLKTAVLLAGGATMLGSIPFFLASKKNHKRAASVSVKTERAIHSYSQRLVRTSFPALAIKLQL
jgi:hypothetical protein